MLLPSVTHLALLTGPGTQVKGSSGGSFWIKRHNLMRVLMSLLVLGSSSHFIASSPTSPAMGMKSTMGRSRPDKPLFLLPENILPIGPWKHSPLPVFPSEKKVGKSDKKFSTYAIPWQVSGFTKANKENKAARYAKERESV